MDTVFAVSSGLPPAAIAVLRITGPEALSAATALAGTLPEPRRAGLRALRDPASGLLDRALVLTFPGPDSATGEDLVELHLHGGRAIVAAVSAALAAMGLRPAEAGQFTRRALANGRIDLAKAEGLGDLLAAETEGQRIAALSMAEGLLSRRVQGWFDRIAMLSARIEADLDFSDEDDVAGGDVAAVLTDMKELAKEIDAILAEPPVERLRDGIRVVLAGPPNSGKSSLLNALVERDAAIVSPIAGTTRDRIEAPVVRDGIVYLLIDTAGLASGTSDTIEAIGIGLAEQAVATADIVLWLGDTLPPRPDALWLHARADLPDRLIKPAEKIIAVSHRSSDTIAAVWRLLASTTEKLLPTPGRLAMNARQRQCVDTAARSLAMKAGGDSLIVAEHLRLSRAALAALLGVNATEAMLDSLFGQFCIGK